MQFSEVTMLKLVITLLMSAAVVSSASDKQNTLSFPNDNRSCEEVLSEKASALAKQAFRKQYPHAIAVELLGYKVEQHIDTQTYEVYNRALVFNMSANISLADNFPAQIPIVPFNIVQNKPCVLQVLEP